MEEYRRWLDRSQSEVEYKIRNSWSRQLVDRNVISLALSPVLILWSSLCALEAPHHVRPSTVVHLLRRQPRSS
jgi:hypothetical protein